MAKRGKFSLSHRKLFTCDLGELIPCGLVEVLPGDTFQMASSALVRASPMLAPPMHPVEVRIHHWFVPFRLVWSSWEDFITGGPSGTSLPVFPTISIGSGLTFAGSLGDYLGIPLQTAVRTYSALPFRTYCAIWNAWYRDQDLEAEVTFPKTDGSDGSTAYTPGGFVLNCDWEKDYFTSARPWELKGPTITLPLGSTAPVVFSETGATPGTRTLQRNAAAAVQPLNVTEAGTATAPIIASTDLSAATAATVNTLRQAMALQRFEEARARYGSRYVEYLRYLGVRSSDARLQRPEYLGGGRDIIQFSEVLQTAQDGTNPVATMRGHGISAMRSHRFRRFFEEHGYIMSLFSVRPKTMYVSGVRRTFNRRVKEDFWQLELQHIGQQKVLNKEVYSNHTSPDGTFGYQDRYDEYRRQESEIAGEFRTTLNQWHFGRAFAADPSLNATFVKCVPSETPFAVPANDVLWVQMKHSIQARRLVAQTGTSFIF